MNYLDLCRRACVECGVASGANIAAIMPTTRVSAGNLARVVNWVNDAWNELQMVHDDWDWMRSSVLLGGGVSFPTSPGRATYSLGTGPGTVGVAEDAFGKWDVDTLRCGTTMLGYRDETFLDVIGFDTWRDAYMYGSMRTVQTRPVAAAIGPDQSICLGPPSNGLYTVTADYWRAPSVMVADTDTPTGLPSRFHMLIVYRMMLKYAGYESAPEVMQRGALESARMMANLEAVRGPAVGFGGALC